MDDSTKRRLIEMAAKYNFYLLLIGVCVRPFILPTQWSYAPLAAGALLAYALVYYLIRRGKIRKYAGFTLFVSTYAVLLPFLLFSGGIHSHLAYLLPIGPVFAGLVLTERSSWLVALLTAALVVFLGLTVAPIGEPLSVNAALPKMVWLILAIFLGSGFARFFANENRHLADALKHQAHMDYLTGVLNRRGAESAMARELELARAYDHPLAIFMLDLDYFKRFNDINGHVDGDKCLSDIGQRLGRLVSEQRGTIGRYGGEEFIVALPGCGREFAGKFADILRQAVSDMAVPLKRGQEEILTASVGYCQRPAREIPDLTAMIARADARLYACKSLGRNQVLGDVMAETRGGNNQPRSSAAL